MPVPDEQMLQKPEASNTTYEGLGWCVQAETAGEIVAFLVDNGKPLVPGQVGGATARIAPHTRCAYAT